MVKHMQSRIPRSRVARLKGARTSGTGRDRTLATLRETPHMYTQCVFM